MTNTSWNIIGTDYNIESADRIYFQNQTITILNNNGKILSERGASYHALVEVALQRNGCSAGCRGQNGSRNLKLWVGKIWGKEVGGCGPVVQCLKLAEMTGGQVHLAFYGK